MEYFHFFGIFPTVFIKKQPSKDGCLLVERKPGKYPEEEGVKHYNK